MKFTYVWDHDHTLESYLDGIIDDHTQTHVYNCGPEWEMGNLRLGHDDDFRHKLSQVEQIVATNPDVSNRLIYLRGCHSVVPDLPTTEVSHRIENLFGQKDFMWSYLLWTVFNTWCEQTFRVTDLLNSEPNQLLCCLQHRPHAHRISAMLALCKHDLDHRGRCTFANSTDAWQTFIRQCIHSDDALLRHRSHQLTIEAQSLSDHNNMTPTLDGCDHAWDVIPDYHRYLFDIVVESTTRANFFTEKTFKPIFWGKPFVILGSNSQNQILQDLGYETFPEYFDLTQEDNLQTDPEALYSDNITQHYDQIIRPLSDISDSEIPEIFRRVRPKVTHNHSIMVNTLFDDELIPEYLQIPQSQQNPMTRISLEYISQVRSWLTQDEYFKQFV